MNDENDKFYFIMYGLLTLTFLLSVLVHNRAEAGQQICTQIGNSTEIICQTYNNNQKYIEQTYLNREGDSKNWSSETDQNDESNDETDNDDE